MVSGQTLTFNRCHREVPSICPDRMCFTGGARQSFNPVTLEMPYCLLQAFFNPFLLGAERPKAAERRVLFWLCKGRRPTMESPRNSDINNCFGTR